MRIAVVSDIHGNRIALRAVLDHLANREVDVVVNLGDCLAGPLWPEETRALLAELNFPTVRGNHDRDESLPRTLRLADDVIAMHGTPDDNTEYLLDEKIGERLVPVQTETIRRRLGAIKSGLVLCGHSHTQRVVQCDEVTIVNPGAVGFPRYALDDDVQSAESGSWHARYAIVSRSAHGWDAEMFALAYDNAQVISRCRARPESE